MNTLQKLFEETIAELISKIEIPEDQLADVLSKKINKSLPRISKSTLDALKKDAPRMLKERRRMERGFQKRNFERWQPGIDLLEMLYVICEETGEEFDKEFRSQAATENDYIFEALTTSHAKALLVASEIICLIKGGFADGALGRWRSLHEIAVVAHFLVARDQEMAERYLASFHVQAYRAMLQYQEYAERANLKLYPKQDMENAEKEYDEILQHYGNEMKNEYGWASLVFKKAKPTFFDLEKNVGLDHWRPRYKWSSSYNHANFKPPSTLLGMGEAREPIMLVGPSNSGMTDPAQMMAISLPLVTTALLNSRPSIDRLVISKIILRISNEVGKVFWKTEKDTLKRHLSKRGAKKK